jgi:hypothetical protein
MSVIGVCPRCCQLAGSKSLNRCRSFFGFECQWLLHCLVVGLPEEDSLSLISASGYVVESSLVLDP